MDSDRGIDVSDLSPLEQTALLTQYARALDSRWPRPILGDALADEIVAKIDYDFAALGVPTAVLCQAALRAKMLDDRVRAFTSEHPDAAVVDLGAGLDTGLFRVGPPAMVIADGLFAFLSEEVIVGVLHRVTEHFESGELAFNDYRRIGWVKRVAVRLAPQRMFSDVGVQWGYAGFKDARVPQSWNPRLTLVEETSLAHAPEVDLFPGRIRLATKVSGRFTAGARKARILRYRF